MFTVTQTTSFHFYSITRLLAAILHPIHIGLAMAPKVLDAGTFDTKIDIPDLSGKEIFVTGGEATSLLYTWKTTRSERDFVEISGAKVHRVAQIQMPSQICSKHA